VQLEILDGGVWRDTSTILARHQIHPETGALIVQMLPGDQYRIVITNKSDEPLYMGITVDGNPALGGVMYVHDAGARRTWDGWSYFDGTKTVVTQPFICAEIPSGIGPATASSR
jgi:hypothetical protein